MRKNLIILILGFLAPLLLAGVVAGLVRAQTPLDAQELGLTEDVRTATGLTGADVRLTIARIVRVGLTFLGVVAIVLMLYAGYQWMTAGGNEEQIGSAKKTMVNAAIGLAIILSAYAIVSFVISKLVEATTGVPAQCTNLVQDGGELDVDCGGPCPACGPASYARLRSIFYVAALPTAGQLCLRNPHPTVVFSRDVDLATLPGNAVVQEKENGAAVPGAWQAGGSGSVAVFVPQGACPEADGGTDCLSADTTYVFRITNPAAVKTADGALSLTCGVRAGCGPLDFRTGESIDRQPPTITIRYPAAATPLSAGATVPATVSYVDDLGLQNLTLFANGSFVESVIAPTCVASGELTLNWPTAGLNAGAYTLRALGLDGAGQTGEDSVVATLRPAHCFDNIQNEGETGLDCGGACGSCAGGACRSGTDCASGWCQIESGAASGICLNRMRIEDISPRSGAPTTFVTVSGYYLGEDPGAVYFAKVANPRANNNDDWVPADPVACSVPTDTWTQRQILVSVPVAAVAGPLKAVTANLKGPDGVARQFIDFTNDAWGPLIPDFQVTAEKRPGICALAPAEGGAGDPVKIVGQNFGVSLNNSQDRVEFGLARATVRPNDWADPLITVPVPSDLAAGAVAVRVVNDGVESNGLRFTVKPTVAPDQPIIYGITPERGAGGTYLTLRGKNFGKGEGAVWFRENSASPVIKGDLELPAACKAAGVWRDNEIIVKFPAGQGSVNRKYLVQVKPAGHDPSPLDNNISFTLTAGRPAPGLCRLDPAAGPVPFAPGATMALSGDYFIAGASSEVLHLTFDGEDLSDATVRDVSGQSNGATVNGNITLGEGRIGQGARFDGASFLLVKDADSLDLTDTFTIAFWVKPELNSPFSALVSKDGVDTDATGAYNAYLYDTGAVIYEANNLPESLGTPRGVVRANEWSHVAVTFDASASPRMTIYVNGTSVVVGNPDSPRALVTNLLLGRRGSLAASDRGAFYQGLLDEVRLFRRALSPAEVANLAKLSGGIAAADLPPTAYFWSAGAGGAGSFNDGAALRYLFLPEDLTGVVVRDRSAGDHDGTLQNGASAGELAGRRAVKLDGVDDYIAAPNLNPYQENYTLSAWLYPTSFLKRGLFIGSESCTEYFELRPDGTVFNVHGPQYDPSDTQHLRPQWSALGSSRRLPLNTWTHVAATWDGAQMKIYLNGKLDASQVQSVAVRGGARSLRLSGGCQVGTYAYTGALAGVALYDRALTAPEIQSVAAGGAIAPEVYAGPPRPLSRISLTGRLAADITDPFFSVAADRLTVRPPKDTITGDVVVYRPADRAVSNPLSFTKLDCTQNNNTCTDAVNSKCCVGGAQAGQCVTPTTLCAGETRASGYTWRFATQDIPEIPRVVEFCSDRPDAEGVLALPTPSPSIQWNEGGNVDNANVCRNALAIVEFTLSLDQSTVNNSTVAVNRCSSVADNRCAFPTPLALTDDSYQLKTSFGNGAARREYLELQPSSRRWDDNAWYQVVLRQGIRSAGSATSSAPLAADRPCDDPASAYCFVFKTDEQDCTLRKPNGVMVTPYRYTTRVLESPIRYRTVGGDVGDLYWRAGGLSSQHCIAMDMSGYRWRWEILPVNTVTYADIFGPDNLKLAQASAFSNTVGVVPGNAVPVTAYAVTTTARGLEETPGRSPLTVDLSDPKAVEWWPRCFETCTNSAVGIRFNTTMSNRNLPGAPEYGTVKLFKCLDGNCLSRQSIPVVPELDPVSGYTILQIAGSGRTPTTLLPNTRYQVVVSTSTADIRNATDLLWSAASWGNPASFSKPFNQIHTWTFRTKESACLIDRVNVEPEVFNARYFNDRATFTVEPFSAPDSCSRVGQRLNPWEVSWGWRSSDPQVATVQTFSTRGRNPVCTAACLRKGSDVPADPARVGTFPVCGNGQLEAGEDCDLPQAGSCGLDCRFPGNPDPATCGNGVTEAARGEACDPQDPATRYGCSQTCLRTGSQPAGEVSPEAAQASICGDRLVSSGEGCDLGISEASANPQSALGCSADCLHLGTRLSRRWCGENGAAATTPYVGFSEKDFNSACSRAYSQCGDGIADADEDADCDGPAGWNSTLCTPQCLRKAGDSGSDISGNNCGADPNNLPEGCSETLQHTGSSLLYSQPSVCGDGTVGIGEDASCEDTAAFTTLRQSLTDPWALATGVGRGTAAGTPPRQEADIIGATSNQTRGGTIEGSGKFVIQCGYRTDAECQAIDPEFGVGSDSCCYARPQLISTNPPTSTPPIGNVCPNTYLQAVFDQPIDAGTLPGNLLIARGLPTSPTASPEIRHVSSFSAGDDPTGAAKLWSANAVEVVGRFAYVAAAGDDALEIIDVGNPERPLHLGFLSAANDQSRAARLDNPRDVKVVGKFAYLAVAGTAGAAGSHALEIVDISNPKSPQHVAALADDNDTARLPKFTDPTALEVTGRYIYLVDTNGNALHVIDLVDANKPTPRHLGSLVNDGQQITTLQLPRDVVVAGDYAYVTGAYALNVVDISDPSSPRLVTALRHGGSAPPSLSRAQGFSIVGRYAYVTSFDGNALEIIDLGADGKSPQHVATFTAASDPTQQAMLNGPRAVAVANGYALVAAAKSNALEVIKVTDPENPSHVALLSHNPAAGVQLQSVSSVKVVGNYAYLTSPATAIGSALEIVDISELVNPPDSCPEDVTTLVARASADSPSRSWLARLGSSLKRWLQRLIGSKVEARLLTNPKRWCAGRDFGSAEVIVPDPGAGTSQVVVRLQQPLATETNYAVILKDGIKSRTGVSIGAAGAKPISWKFNTGPRVCEIDSVSVAPAQWQFSRAGATTTLVALASTVGGAAIQPISGVYAWQYLWGPSEHPSVDVQSTTSSSNIITAKNQNGEVDVVAAAEVYDNSVSAAKDIVAAGRSHVIVNICENPWPPKDRIVSDARGTRVVPVNIFPYEDKAGNNDAYDLSLMGPAGWTGAAIPGSQAVRSDGWFNFSTYYCADAGRPGDTSDDLPYLRPAVQWETPVVSANGFLKRFIFTTDKDAIGIQVFPNPEHLAAADWYAAEKAKGGQGFQGTVSPVPGGVDGYPAVTDGNNIYVDALNYSSVTNNLFSTIYVFSINANAAAPTRQVFDQLMKNLKFNINLTNYRYCGTTPTAPAFVKQCSNDLECPAGAVCSAQTDKLKRTYQRLRNLNIINTALENFARSNNNKYPDLPSGSFLPGQTVSTWPQSWNLLGETLGVGSLPGDPVNPTGGGILGPAGTCASSTARFCTSNDNCGLKPNTNIPDTCVLHDAQTGWSTADRRFSFACATSSLAFRYIYSTTTAEYRVRARAEDSGFTWANRQTFVDDFIDQTKFIIFDPSGICQGSDPEIVSLTPGYCGNGAVNLDQGEQCDPPGKTRYGSCLNNEIAVDTCDSNCHWTPSTTPNGRGTIACSALTKCGNGLVEAPYETCDDGIFNGRYSRCNLTCSGRTAEYCGNNILERQELCEVSDIGNAGYDGWCTGGIRSGAGCNSLHGDADCNAERTTSTFSGICRRIFDTKVKYAASRSNSCNFDCQSAGPYCGDNLVQAEWGEECEPGANNSCPVGGQTGQRFCTNRCRWGDPQAAAWWRLNDRELVNNATGWTYDETGAHTATCRTPGCPTVIAGQVKGALQWDGSDDFLTVRSTPELSATTSLTIAGWIKPSDYGANNNRILEKGGWQVGPGYGWEFNQNKKLRFALWQGPQPSDLTALDSAADIALGAWTHLATTYERAGNAQVMRVYVNGKLDSERVLVNEPVALASSTDPLYIGRASVSPSLYFPGVIDELRILTRALTAPEIVDLRGTPGRCLITPVAAAALSPAGYCGDGKIQSKEACDNGTLANGRACLPGYERSCTYCSGQCDNIITVEAAAYCGNGQIDNITSVKKEVCDTDPDPASKKIYSAIIISGETGAAANGGYEVLPCSSPVEPYIVKKGTKVCANKCSELQNQCLRCGLTGTATQPGTGTVGGGIINVLDPASSQPLTISYTKINQTTNKPETVDLPSKLLVRLGTTNVAGQAWPGVSASTYYLRPASEDISLSVKYAVLNSDSRCSYGDPPNYTLQINSDLTPTPERRFPIIPSPAPAAYDLVLSPVIPRDNFIDPASPRGFTNRFGGTARPNDIRVVVRWTGGEKFIGGFLIPGGAQPTVEGDTLRNKATGWQYYRNIGSGFYQDGIWHHGAGETAGGSHAEAFTLDTSRMLSGALAYSFYVRLKDTSALSRVRTRPSLTVEVYLPEDGAALNHFGAPAPTAVYTLESADPLDNPAAPYWQVVSITPTSAGVVATLNNVKIVNELHTETTSFNFSL